MQGHVDQDKYDACPEFNEWLDDRYVAENDVLRLFGYEPRPSFVLHQLSFATYKAAYADFISDREERLKELIHSNFPTPIAHYYYRFDKGYENEIQRLHLLRDAWEATTDVLHTLVVGESRYRQLGLVAPIAFRDILSDRMADRLLTIERIINYANSQSIALDTGHMIPAGVLDSMRELNRSRNAFSHSAAQSETQARTWIAECYEEMIDIFDKLQGLAGISILRYLSQVDARTLRCEVFRGYHLTRTIQSILLSDDQIRNSQRYFRQNELLAKVQDSIFSIRPLMYFREDTSGHTTKLCAFRKTHGDGANRMLEYEVISESVRWNERRTTFQPEIDELRALFGLGPETP